MNKKIKLLIISIKNKTSNNNQLKSIAINIDRKYQEIIIEPNFLYKINKIVTLPTRFIYKNFSQIKKTLKNLNESFNTVASCGQVSLKLLKYIKKTNNSIKTIHILKPNFISKYIDCLLIPNHDKLNFLEKIIHGYKIIEYNGSFYDHKHLCSNYSDEELEFSKKIDNVFQTQSYVSIFIGGDSKYFNYNQDTAEKFLKMLNNLKIKYSDSAFLISTSRRTPEFFYQYIKNNTKVKKVFFFNQNTSENLNPYKVYLQKASLAIVTYDSISMMSECIEKFDKLIIYKGNIVHKKSKIFLDKIKNKIIDIEKIDDYFISKKLKSINNMKRISTLINKVLYGKK